MQLRVTDYHGVSRWRWELQDDAGNFLADLALKLYERLLNRRQPLLAGLRRATYARALRSVRQLRVEQAGAFPLACAVDGILVAVAVAPLARPLQEQGQRLISLHTRLNAGAELRN